MVYSIIKISQLEGAKRLDAEYYQPEYLAIKDKLNSCSTNTIGEVAESVVNFGAYSLCNHIVWRESGVPYLNVGDIRDGYIDFENVKYIDELVDRILKKSSVREGQVIVTMAGTIGNVAVAHKLNGKVNSNQATAKITLKDGWSPYFIAAFFRSKYGEKQILREIVSSVQPNIFLGQIKEFKIPVVAEQKQKEIAEIYVNSLEQLSNSKLFYNQAEGLLLDELGLKGFIKEDEKLFSIVNLSEVKETGRIDADYFQNKYEKLIEIIRKVKNEPLENFIVKYSTGYPYESDHYQVDGLPLIRINNIKKGLLDLGDTAYLPESDFVLSSKDVAVAGDIVLSMSGTIGNTALIPVDIKNCLINQRILKFTPKGIEANFLVLLLNSIIGNYQLERIGTGGVQTNISYKDIKKILIPVLPEKIQKQIADLVVKSHEAKKKAKELLEEAKNKVEKMIENNN